MPVEPPIATPASLSEAYAVLADSSADSTITPIAGGTDVMVRITGEIGDPPARMVDLSRLEELRGIALDRSTVVLGALATYTEIRGSGVCREHLPALVEAAATIGAAQIQNRGTIGGNIANASPAGDTLPVLLALDAAIEVGGPRGERTVRADEFWIAYRRTALAPDELILRISIPLTDRKMRFRKVGTRRAQAISKVVAALSWREAIGHPQGAWTDVRLALGSVADRPIRARATEAVLTGAAPNPETADYRRAAAARVLHRMIRDAGGW